MAKGKQMSAAIPANGTNGDQGNGKDQVAGPLAKWIVGGGLSYIALLSLVAIVGVIFVSVDKQETIIEQWKDILTFTLPVLGAWVGTVLAFYFSKENFEAANQSVRAMVDQLATRDLKSVLAKSVMIPRTSITDIKLSPALTEAQISLTSDVLPRFEGKVTRLPVFSDTDAAKYVVHESIAHRFVLKEIRKPGAAADPKLQDLLNEPNCKAQVTALAFVAESASLADAQDAMKRTQQCQDIFVTRNGRPDEPVLGWITNAEIAKQVEA